MNNPSIKDKLLSNKVGLSYTGLALVICIWGISPLVATYFFQFLSPTLSTFISAVVSVSAMFLMSFKKLHLINKNYLKVAIPTGIFYSLAGVFEKLGVYMTTPTTYAFLEIVSCVVVPLLMWLFIKKRPTLPKIIACILCLTGAFILSGASKEGIGFSLGEIICLMAGVFYGVNIAATGAFSKKLDTMLYLLVQMTVECIVSFTMIFVLNSIHITDATNNSVPFEPIMFKATFGILCLFILSRLIISVFCWVTRTASMKHVDATVIAIMMPFSSVITGVLSVIIGYDTISSNLIIGAVLGFSAIMLSGLADVFETKKHAKKVNS